MAADLSGAFLVETNFTKTDLEDANLSAANFTRTKFVSEDLTNIHFSENFSVQFDYSDTIISSHRDRLLNWSLLRRLGQLPLFGVSWIALGVALTTINTIGVLNRGSIVQNLIHTPIPYPQRMTLVLIATLLLVLGTTFYRLACPSDVQEFSETQWVRQHNQPRLLYLREMWRRRWAQWPTLIFSVLGAVLALLLLGERLVLAAKYLLG
jgi:hypothetical protein